MVVGESRIETQLVFIDKAKASRAPILFADQTYRVLGQISRPPGTVFRNRKPAGRLSLPDRQRSAGTVSAQERIDGADGAGRTERGRAGFPSHGNRCFGELRRAARTTGLMGRWQQLGERPLVVCDTGHNEAGITEVAAQACRAALSQTLDGRRLRRGQGLVEGICRCCRKTLTIFLPGQAIRRALDEKELARRAGSVRIARGMRRKRFRGAPFGQVAGRPEDLIFVGGSTYVVAEII